QRPPSPTERPGCRPGRSKQHRSVRCRRRAPAAVPAPDRSPGRDGREKSPRGKNRTSSAIDLAELAQGLVHEALNGGQAGVNTGSIGTGALRQRWLTATAATNLGAECLHQVARLQAALDCLWVRRGDEWDLLPVLSREEHDSRLGVKAGDGIL